MKTGADHYTRDLLGNKPGRPRKANAKTGAQRTREHRQRKAISVTGNGNSEPCAWCGAERSSCCGICTIGQLGRKD